MIDFKKTILKNGLRIITAPMRQTKAVSIILATGVGSRYEEKPQNGLSHFIEHMCFKGTKKRPTTLDISKELDSIGANYNAFTSEEETAYFARAEASHFSLILDILTDMVLNSKFATEEIEREKGVIIEEINMYQDLPQRYVQDLAKNLFYGDTPLGRSTAGTVDIVSKFKQIDFLKYRQDFYAPDNMAIVIAGSGNQKKWIDQIKEKLGHLKSKKAKNYESAINIQTQSQSLIYPKKTDQAHLILGLRTFSRHSKNMPTLRIINNILGDTMSSRLFTEVRERRGLAYYVSSDFNDFDDTGYLAASAGVDVKRVKEAVKVILEEFKKIKTDGITQKELTRAKDNLKGRLYIGLEDSLSVAEFLAEQALLDKSIKSPEQIIKEIQSVDLKAIKTLSQEIFTDKNLNFTIIGPYDKKEDFKIGL